MPLSSLAPQLVLGKALQRWRDEGVGQRQEQASSHLSGDVPRIDQLPRIMGKLEAKLAARTVEEEIAAQQESDAPPPTDLQVMKMPPDRTEGRRQAGSLI